MTQVLNTTNGELTTRHGFTFQPGLNTLTDEQLKQAGEDPMVERWTQAGYLADPASVVVPGASALDEADRAELARLRALEQAGALGTAQPPTGDPPPGDPPVGDPPAGDPPAKAKAKDKDPA